MKKLGSLNKAAAWLIAAAIVLIAVFGIGGLKLSSKYTKAEKSFNKSCSGSFKERYEDVLSYAGQIEAGAYKLLGSDDTSVTALSAELEEGRDARSDYEKAYLASGRIYTAAERVRSAARVADQAAASQIEGSWDNLRSVCNTIQNNYSKAYNTYIDAKEDLKGGFPASMIKSLWGIGGDEN